MSVAMFATLYNKNAAKSNIRIPFNKIKATQKWVQHSINLHVMQKLLLTASREDRYTLLAAIKVAESKVNYHYKHPNFDLAQAVTLFKQAKRMLRNQ